MNVISDILTMAWKDLKVLFKDRGELATIFLMPLLFSFLFGAPGKLMGDLDEPGSEPALEVKAYVVNEDAGPYGAQVAVVLDGIKMLDTEELATVDEADEKVAEGEAPAAIVIPGDFSQKINANKPTKVRIIKDPTHQTEATIVAAILNDAMAELSVRAEIEYGIRAVWEKSGALEGAAPETVRAAQAQTMGAIWTAVQEMRQNPVIAVERQDLAGEETQSELNPFSYTMPMFAMMFAFFLVGTMAGSILKEKEAGTFRRLLAAPIYRGAVIAGKMLAYIVIVFLQMLLLFTVGSALFEMPLGDSPIGLFLLTLAIGLAATGLGMLVGAVARSAKQAGYIGLALGFVLYGASGSIMSSGSLSDLGFRSAGFQFYLSQLTPHAHAFDGYLKLMVEGGGLVDILPNIAALVGFAVAFFLVAMSQFKFE
jgi:ABC-2 type transport system permease protein